jgi:hypothetical protein
MSALSYHFMNYKSISKSKTQNSALFPSTLFSPFPPSLLLSAYSLSEDASLPYFVISGYVW